MPERQITLHQSPGVFVRLSYYGSGERMRPHEHQAHQLSWLLTGELSEQTPHRSCEVITTARGSKPADCVHANLYGRHGALVLSVNLDAGASARLLPDDALDWGWAPAATAPAAALMPLIAAGGDIATEAVCDLVALDGPDVPRPAAARPAWLQRVREHLLDCEDALDLTALAAEHGVHRVHLSRAFTRHFGLSPSLYRARTRTARAVSMMIAGEGAATAAASAGFADQSHFNRWLKKQTGLAPFRLQQMMAG